MHVFMGTLKPVEAIKKGMRKRRIKKRMNHSGVHCTHIWKYHS
jgi:hypothetical protein